MSVQSARHQEVGQREAKGCFLPVAAVDAEEAGRRHLAAEIDVRHDGEEHIEARREALQHVCRAHGVLRMFHFGDEHKEHEVPGEGEDRIRDGEEGGVEVTRLGRDDAAALGGVDACRDNADQPGDEDARARETGEQVEGAEGAGQGDQEGGACEDAGVRNRAELSIRERRQGLLAGQELGAGTKDSKGEGAESEDLAAERAEQDVSGVAHGVDLGVVELELDEEVGRVGCEEAEEDDNDDAGGEADGGEGGGDGEHPVGHDLGDHEQGDDGPGQGLVLDVVVGFGAEDVLVVVLVRGWPGGPGGFMVVVESEWGLSVSLVFVVHCGGALDMALLGGFISGISNTGESYSNSYTCDCLHIQHRHCRCKLLPQLMERVSEAQATSEKGAMRRVGEISELGLSCVKVIICRNRQLEIQAAGSWGPKGEVDVR